MGSFSRKMGPNGFLSHKGCLPVGEMWLGSPPHTVGGLKLSSLMGVGLSVSPKFPVVSGSGLMGAGLLPDTSASRIGIHPSKQDGHVPVPVGC